MPTRTVCAGSTFGDQPPRRDNSAGSGPSSAASGMPCTFPVGDVVGVFMSAFIDPDEKQITLAAQCGFDAVELHTGEYANASGEAVQKQLDRLIRAGERIAERGLRLHAGHGLNYHNTLPVARIDEMRELNIGHAIISRAVFTGLRAAVREMKEYVNRET